MIRLGNLNDLDNIMKVITQAQKRMKDASMTQWQNNYPNLEILTQDIKEKALFVYEDNEQIVGTMSVFSYDSVYDSIKGDWLNNNPYKVIHRIAISDSHINQHLTEEMINFIFSYFLINDIRIDTHPLNKPMLKSLERQGFLYCGIVHVNTDSDSLRFAYHKHI
ncbi:MAG: GNAT family protein [Acholeplasmataceae bacterium]|nr:GNAT family protein [Acholeplasmataceae bacterium]